LQQERREKEEAQAELNKLKEERKSLRNALHVLVSIIL
jgi:hypothetical protein